MAAGLALPVAARLTNAARRLLVSSKPQEARPPAKYSNRAPPSPESRFLTSDASVFAKGATAGAALKS